MEGKSTSTEPYDVVAELVAKPVTPQPGNSPSNSNTWLLVGGIVGGVFLLLFVGFVFLIALATMATPQASTFGPPNGYGQPMPNYPNEGLQQLPGGGFVDQNGGYHSGTGMSHGTVDQSGGGNSVYSVDGQVLTLPD